MGVREDKKARNRIDILAAARQQFALKGYHNSSISDIIRGTKLSRATFYVYFPDKIDIYRTLMVDIFQDMRRDFRNLRRDMSEQDLGMNAVINMSSSSLFHMMENHKEVIQTIINSPFGVDEEFDRITKRYIKLLNEATTLAVKRGIARNEITMKSPELAGFLVLGGLKECAERIIFRNEWRGSTEEAIDFINQFYRGALEAFATKK